MSHVYEPRGRAGLFCASALLRRRGWPLCAPTNWPQWRGPQLNGISAETEPAGALVDHREHHLEAGDARAVGIDPDRLGRPHLSRTSARARSLALWCGGSDQGHRAAGSGRSAAATRGCMKQNMSSPSPVTDGRTVWVMTGTGVLKAFDFDGKELLGARHPEGLRPLRPAVGLRVVAAAARGLAVRAGAARHDTPTIRPTCCASTRRPARPCGASSGRRARGSSRPMPTPRRRCCATARPTEIVITGGDVVTGHDPATGRNCGGPTA